MMDYDNSAHDWDGGYINTVYSRDELGRFVRIGFSSSEPWKELYGMRSGYVFTNAKRDKREVFGHKASNVSSSDNIAEFLIAMDMVPDDMDTIICINRTYAARNEHYRVLPDNAPQPGKKDVHILYDDGDAGYDKVEPVIKRGSIVNMDFSQKPECWESFFDQKFRTPSPRWASFTDTPVYSECNTREQGERVAQVFLSDAIDSCSDLLKMNMEGSVLRDGTKLPDVELAVHAVEVLGRGRVSCKLGDVLSLTRQMRNSVSHLMPLARKWAPDIVKKAELLRGICHIWEEGNRRYSLMSGRTLFYDRHGKATMRGLTQRINRDGFVDLAIDAICDGVPLEDVLA